MCDQVYRIGDLRKKVVDALRKRNAPTTSGALCVELGLPLWAVAAGLDAAAVAGMVDFSSPLGYRAVPVGGVAGVCGGKR
jgi:hypothetical protein